MRKKTIMRKIDKNYEFYSKEFSEYLNSYYQQFGVPHDKGLRGVVSRPTTDQIFQYLLIAYNRIDKKLKKLLPEQEVGKEEDYTDLVREINSVLTRISTSNFSEEEIENISSNIRDLNNKLNYKPSLKLKRT